MPLPTVDVVIKDPKFYSLPPEERRKVLQRIDPKFAGLPDTEQVKAVDMLTQRFSSAAQRADLNEPISEPQKLTISRNTPGELADSGQQQEFSALTPPSDMLGDIDLMPAHTPGVIQEPESRLSQALRQTAGTLSPIIRPVLEGAGAMGGAVVGAGAGAPSGPGAVLTGAAGAGLGYASGKGLADALDIYAGVKEPYESAVEPWKETGKDVLAGAAFEVGGQAASKILVGTLKGGKWVFEKAKEPIMRMFTKAGAEKAAGEILVANTSAGPIYARNAAEAAQIEKDIPGLKFTLGQRTGDPNLIKLERTQMRRPGIGAEQNAEQIAANNEALRRYYETGFAGDEGLDDVLKSVSGKADDLKSAQEQAGATVRSALDMPTAEPPVTGQKIVDALSAAKSGTKAKASELYDAVPSGMQIPIDDMLKEFDEIAKPMSRFEEPGNIPSILTRVSDDLAESGVKTMPLEDLQGLRSELLAQSRQAKAAQTPNERLSSRLSRAAKAVENAIGKAEGQEGAQAALKKANKFYREDYSQVFKQGTVGDILRKGPRGEATRIPLARIPDKVWITQNLSAADDFIRSVGKENAGGIMRQHAAYDLMQNVVHQDGKVVTSKLNSWLRKNGKLLERFGIEDDFMSVAKAQEAADAASQAATDFERSVAARLLNADPEKAIGNAIKGTNTGQAAFDLMKTVRPNKAAIKGLQRAFADHIMTQVQTTAKDIAGKPTISNAAFKRIMDKYRPAMRVLYRNEPSKLKTLETMQRAYEIATRNTRSPIGGGSDTAENVLTELGKINLLSRSASIAKGLLKVIAKYDKKKIDELVTRALFDPDYAQALTKAAQGKLKDNEIKMVVKDKIISLEDYKRQRLARMATGIAGTASSVFRDRD